MAVLLRDDDVRAWLGASCKPEDATLAAADDVGAATVVGPLLDCVFGEGSFAYLQPGSPDGDDADRDELRRWATRRRALELAHAWLAGAARAGTAAEADVATERDDRVSAEADVATTHNNLVSSVARLDGPGRAAAVAAMGPNEAEHVGAAVAVRLDDDWCRGVVLSRVASGQNRGRARVRCDGRRELVVHALSRRSYGRDWVAF